ncbi:DUF4433 domain-containing protein [Dermacoccus sp. Ellin185]|uniref:type II toxin-antitoxin system toxin DNA ADP-ribosyl transferase DarT n=1 Tax=Dermacoccus sp. Ellin185 TaxID=188626 RepID=UPI0001E64274|nr:DUF4433 domain-containing protein [Dermacoccus sp. Ellin185]EFP57978.1 hypothetical protein HMPREF0321_1867 [Dermacoccus sp. Ellin185]
MWPGIVHFTRVEHLGTIVQQGLLSDHAVGSALQHEIGNRNIKAQRTRRVVPIPPGGVVADYVPFYFAARSPMMYSIAMGNVPGYAEGTARIVYLVSDVGRVLTDGMRVVISDRNAALHVAAFRPPTVELFAGDFIDWDLMRARYWGQYDDGSTRADGRERRMAECLVHQKVSWGCITHVVAKSEAVAREARLLLGDRLPPGGVVVRPEWYF